MRLAGARPRRCRTGRPAARRLPRRRGDATRRRHRVMRLAAGEPRLGAATRKSEELGGTVKEGVDKATDDEQLEAEGKADQTGSIIKQAGEKIKDAFKSSLT